MTKVAILVGGLPPIYNGGTEIATVQIAKYAARAGHEIHVLALDPLNKGAEEYKALEDGFTVHRIVTPSMPHGREVWAVFALLSEIRKLKPDVVHVQAMYLCPAAYLASMWFRIPYWYYERGAIYVDWRGKDLCYWLFIGQAARVITQTQHQADTLLTKADARQTINIIPNGVEVDRFGKVSKEEARREWGFPQDKRIVLSVGRCRPEKNIGAFVKLAELDRENLYVVAGDGPELNHLKLIGSQLPIFFLGSVPNDEIPSLMAAADVLVNTSHSEGFPNAVLEAMAAGLPIVAPDITGMSEIVEDGVNGYLYRPGTGALTRIRAILSDPCLATFMSVSNRKKAKEYTWENVVRRLYS